MAGSIREMSSEMGDNHGNFDLFRLDTIWVIEPSGRRTRRALEKGEKYCPFFKIEVKKKSCKNSK